MRSRPSKSRPGKALALEALEPRYAMHHCQISFVSSTYSVSESGGTATITVQRSTAAGDVSFDFNAAVGTADGTDFTPIDSQTVTWLNGDPNQKTLTVNITPDLIDEPDETVLLSLDNPVFTTLVAPNSATLTIVDDDAPPSVPVIGNFGGPVSYVENADPVGIAGGATVSDTDSADFDAGQLRVEFSAGGTSDDRLLIATAGNVSTGNDGQVFVDNTLIGFLLGINGNSPLIISFNANATPANVTTLLQSIVYTNVSEGPSATRTVSVQLSDGDGNTSEAVTKDINVTGVNDAPALDQFRGPRFPTVNEGAKNPRGILVSTLIAGAVTDPDPGAVKGIAVISAPNTGGQWQYSLNSGTQWFTLTGVSDSAARLLPSNPQTRIRFLPAATGVGARMVQLRAWDQTQGTAGKLFNAAAKNGGTNSCSTETEFGTIVVNKVPVLRRLGPAVTYTHDRPKFFLAPAARVIDPDSGDFNGGRLTIRFTGPLNTSNHLGIGGKYKLVGTKVMFGMTEIGERLLVPTAGQDLYIQFNGNATRVLVEGLVRSITFSTLHGKAGKRNIVFNVSDGDGGTSLAKTKVVNVV